MSLDRDGPLLLVLFVLVSVAVFLAAAETALIRIPHVRATSLAAEGSRPARRVASLLDDLPRVLNAILLSALLVQIGSATVTGVLSQRWFGSLGITMASVVLTIVLFIYAEAIPKTYAVRHPDRVALALAGPVAVLERLVRPVVSLLVWVADLQMPGKGITTSPTITEDELRRLAFRAAREGEITEEDLTLIERAFRLGDRRTDDVMVPRPDVVAVPEDATVETALDVALAAGHRRLPVYRQSVEDISGVVRLRDLIQIPPERRGLAVRHLAEHPLVVPESKRLLELLREMQSTRTHLAVVVDEYGGTAGIVTVEDIVEELLGTISDEEDGEEVVRLEGGRWLIDGSLPVEDLEEIVDVTLPSGDWNTAAGLVQGLVGRVASIGDEVEVDGYRLRVAGMRRRRITRIEVSRAANRSQGDSS